MTWWCAATRVPWSWQPRAYPGVWVFVAGLALAGVLAARRSGMRPSGRQAAAWWGGLAALWVASDWPVGTLGSGYLASAHMLQYFLYTFVAAPLLVLAVPEALARRGLARARLYRAYRALSRPLVAGAIANVVLVTTHAPVTVDLFRSNQLGSFVLDLAWLAGGLALWLPVCGPIPEAKPSYPARAVYLFFAAGLVPMVPGGFLTFADFPLYSTYELAPRVGGIHPLEDQQVAGALMKVGNLPLIWPVIGALFWRWSQAERGAVADA
jgi:putative membrane protein